MQVVLASRNQGKLKEMAPLLASLGVELIPVSSLAGVPEVDETGETFCENAVLKAETVSAATGLPSIADDSGLVVEALQGAPGVRSARFAGPDATDQKNNRLLLQRLQGVPAEERSAAFVCVIALARPGQATRLFEGRAPGRILEAPVGEGGFGYDPLFLSDALGVTFGEAADAQKGRVSHRGQAIGKLLEFWQAEE